MLKTTNKRVLMFTKWTLRKMCNENIPLRFNDQELLSVADEDKYDELFELYKVLAEEDVYLQIVEFLCHDPKYSQLALMVIGNLAPCGKAQKQELSLALSGYLSKLFLKEACWIIGNLVGGTTCHLQV
ncbi:unnamed protein product [Vicia faba]|uniref:Uncharacterized protein n=1 Tax=Vicia faba TaxID=3906 RepID=A0AAV0YWM1_VICFA|nr:unnamed protein product [Vicia faba]